MAQLYGITYNRTPAQNLLRQRLTSSLNPTQQQERSAFRSANQAYVNQLNPEQFAERQKWHIEKMEGNPQWKSDKQAFLSSLNPTQIQARTNTLNLRNEFVQALSPEQRAVWQSLLDARNANVLNALGQNGSPGGLPTPYGGSYASNPTPTSYGGYQPPITPSITPGGFSTYA